jgi:hypothetical protein
MPDNTDGLKLLRADIESVFARIAKLQAEPADSSGLEGFGRAENMLGAIEHYITMARRERAKYDPALKA